MNNKLEQIEILEYYQRWLNDSNKSAIIAMYDIIQDNIYAKKYSIDSKIAASNIITYNLINQKIWKNRNSTNGKSI